MVPVLGHSQCFLIFWILKFYLKIFWFRHSSVISLFKEKKNGSEVYFRFVGNLLLKERLSHVKNIANVQFIYVLNRLHSGLKLNFRNVYLLDSGQPESVWTIFLYQVISRYKQVSVNFQVEKISQDLCTYTLVCVCTCMLCRKLKNSLCEINSSKQANAEHVMSGLLPHH